MTTKLDDFVEAVQAFQGQSLKGTIAKVEESLSGRDVRELASIVGEMNLFPPSLLGSALAIKKVAGQINVIIHAIGILTALPKILDGGERIESLSLGAGNTGKSFDVETNRRVAEFKFIHWRGADSVRQDALFKDFFVLAEAETDKNRFLYVVGLYHPLKFLNGNRSLDSVMSKNRFLREKFKELHGGRFLKVVDYFRFRRDRVVIQDIAEIVPELVQT